MSKAADIAGPISLTVLVKAHLGPRPGSSAWNLWSLISSGHQASQVTNRDQFAVTQVTIEVMKRSRNPPRFEKDRYEGFIYSNSVPESMILRDRSSYRPFRVRARDEDFANVSLHHLEFNLKHLPYSCSPPWWKGWVEVNKDNRRHLCVLAPPGPESRCEIRGPVQQLRQRDPGRLCGPEESGEDGVLRAAGDRGYASTTHTAPACLISARLCF